MRNRVVGVIEIERRSLKMVEFYQPRPDQADQPDRRLRRIHPDAVDRDVVAHEPGVRQFQPRSPRHATPPISATCPFGRTVMTAARTVVDETEGGMISSTQSIGPGAARFIISRSSFSLPLSFTVRTRSPKRRERSF